MERNTVEPNEFVSQVESAPPGVKPLQFTLRDDNAQRYHRQMRLIKSPVSIKLAWRADAKSHVHSLGLFRLDPRRL
jgi:hypothetical protein